jgi:peptidoglycan hydrolase-like protein with peptidoglycan-binding domain
VGLLTSVAVSAVGALAATGELGGSPSEGQAVASTGRPATTKVRRTTLSESATVSGKLGYGDTSAVVSPAPDSGLVTWLPKAGDVLTRGSAVYRVNQRTTPLLYGDIPIYRTLKPGDSGSDVKILEQNLKALGYDGFTADSHYTSATDAAVRDWQDDLNRDETGTVKPGDAVVAPGPRKIADVQAQVGAPATGSILSWTATERLVTVDLDARYEDLVKPGTKAKVELPDGTTLEAVVTDVGAPTTPQEPQEGEEDKDATLPVELEVKNQKGLGRYQAASVDVILQSKVRKNVLAVPISALVARDGGGYALEVADPSAPSGFKYVPVKAGMFSDSMVEVSGPGITESTVVGVPQ